MRARCDAAAKTLSRGLCVAARAPSSLDLKEIAMENRWCSACGCAFLPRPQTPRQSYCALPECRRERRRIWQLAKRQTDPDYRLNQTRAQQAWAARNPDYWRRYRQEHPEYAERNRVRQRDRRQLRKRTDVAKMVASERPSLLEAGIYRLVRLDPEDDANMDVWTVRLTVLSGTGRASEVDRGLQREDLIDAKRTN